MTVTMKRRVLVGAWLTAAVIAVACAHSTNGEDPIRGIGGTAGTGGRANTANTGGPSSTTTTTSVSSTGGASGSSTTDGGGSGGVGGVANTEGGIGGSGAAPPEGGAAGAPTTTEGSGGTVPEDECTDALDCEQPEGACVVCELGATAARECVNLGPSVCDGETRDACELCDGTDLGDVPTNCVDYGDPGEFSGGKVVCNDSCDGYDTSGCTVCGNDVTDPGEACDGDDVPSAKCANLGLPPPSSGDDDLPCLDSCEYDSADCELCSVAEADCLLGAD